MFLDDYQLEPLYIYAFYTHAFSFPISFSQKKNRNVITTSFLYA